MSDSTLSDIDFRIKMACVWTTLKIFQIVANLTGLIQVDGDELLTGDLTGMILM